MSERRTYRELEIWQLGMQLASQVYALTQDLPSEERFGLTSQMRRAAVSIPANIAEGFGRASDKPFANHIRIARGSLAELETLVELAHEMGYVHQDLVPLHNLTETLGRKTFNFLQTLDAKSIREEAPDYDSSQQSASPVSVQLESI